MKARPHHVVTMPWSHSIVSEAFDATEEPPGNGAPAPAPVSGETGPIPEFKVVKTEKFHAQPMSVADAIVQLNLTHEPFLVFRRDDDGGIAVVYRREDGAYGLIETAPGVHKTHSFLWTDGSPLRHIAEELIAVLGAEGSIIVYSGFEEARIWTV